MKYRSRAVVAIVLAGLLCASLEAQAAQFTQLVRRVPGGTTVLVMVDVDRLLASPIAAANGWKDKLSKDFERRPLLLPPRAHKLLRAIDVDLETRSAASEITLLEVSKGMTLEKIADRQKGYLEEIANTKVAWLPKGAYGVKLTDEQFAFLFPSNRQTLARWLRDKSGQTPQYLFDSAREMNANNGPQVMVAVDLEDFVEPGSLVERLREFVSLGESKDKLESMAKVLEGIRGARFNVTFEKDASVRLVVNFDAEVGVLAPVAKALLLEVLGRQGLAIDEADDWVATAEGRQLVFSGKLSDSGLMRLSTLLELPSDLIDDPEVNADAENPALYATQAYYKKVQGLLDDLFQKKKQSFGQYAQWAEQYAQKIDRLPLLNVDKEMQDYGTRISDLLRTGAKSFKGVGIRSAGRQSQVWNSGYVTYGYYGWSTYDASGQEKRAIRGQEKATGAMDAAEMRRLIDAEAAAIRKVMVDRYKVEF